MRDENEFSVNSYNEDDLQEGYIATAEPRTHISMTVIFHGAPKPEISERNYVN